MHVYIRDDANRRGSTSYLEEQPLDRQSQCTHIPWSQLPNRRQKIVIGHANGQQTTVYQVCLSQYEASTRVLSLGGASDMSSSSDIKAQRRICIEGATYNASSVMVKRHSREKQQQWRPWRAEVWLPQRSGSVVAPSKALATTGTREQHRLCPRSGTRRFPLRGWRVVRMEGCRRARLVLWLWNHAQTQDGRWLTVGK
jgi:hypothetical protein